MPDNKKLLKELESLAQLDIDAVRAYTAAIDHIDLPDVKEQLTSFREDHERHITDLTPFIVQLGGQAPKHSPDLKGVVIQGFTMIRSMSGNEGALKAMKTNEELTNKNYAQALEYDFPPEMMTVIQQNRDDERRHLDYVNQCVNQKVWEHKEKKAA